MYRYPHVHRWPNANKTPTEKGMRGKKLNNFNLQLIKLTKIWRHVKLHANVQREKNSDNCNTVCKRWKKTNEMKRERKKRTPQMQYAAHTKINKNSAVKTTNGMNKKQLLETNMHLNTCINYTSTRMFEKRSAFSFRGFVLHHFCVFVCELCVWVFFCLTTFSRCIDCIAIVVERFVLTLNMC